MALLYHRRLETTIFECLIALFVTRGASSIFESPLKGLRVELIESPYSLLHSESHSFLSLSMCFDMLL